MNNNRQYAGNAFVSCSLRKEDKPFVDYVCKILDIHNFRPFGTVGKFSASPENPVALMKKNIPVADIVAICATPRYVQRDLITSKVSYGLSEMVHVETGMAIAHNKPVVVFVQQGTDIGSALPNITQYIVLNGQKQDYLAKQRLISSLLKSADGFVKEIRNNNNLRLAGKVVIGGLAIYGGVKLIQSILEK